MRCEQVMKRDVEFVTGADTVQAAARKMRSANIGFLPVCDPTTKKVIGAITDRDLALRVIADAKGADTPIAAVMTQDIVSCKPEDDVARAEQLMSSRQKSRMIVTGPDSVLMGVISLSDLAQHDDRNATRTLREVSQREARAA